MRFVGDAAHTSARDVSAESVLSVDSCGEFAGIVVVCIPHVCPSERETSERTEEHSQTLWTAV